jgi:2-dehydro-3-deoxygalactonokinase
MIGHELAALANVQRRRRNQANLPAIVLIGNAQLCTRYQRALDACGFAQVTLAEQATERGLWQLARAAGLIDSSSR